MILTKSKIYEIRMIVPELLDEDFLKFYFRNTFFDNGFCYAVLKNYKKFIYFFLKKGYNWWWKMEKSVEGGHEQLIDLFISLGANYWDSAMILAASKGRLNLVHFFISKGANDCYLDSRCEELQKYF